jgi:hypothetical protein
MATTDGHGEWISLEKAIEIANQRLEADNKTERWDAKTCLDTLFRKQAERPGTGLPDLAPGILLERWVLYLLAGGQGGPNMH